MPMTVIFVFIGVALGIFGLLMLLEGRGNAVRERGNSEDTSTPPLALPPPALPPRRNAGGGAAPASLTSSASQTQTRRAPQGTLPALPSRGTAAAVVRRTAAPATGAGRAVGVNVGPRGILPAQFPCCPLCKQRNVPGQGQLIFWDSGAEGYRCSRGHRFKKNGTIV